MFEIQLRPEAVRRLRSLRCVDVVAILKALEKYLRHEPERPSRSRIKRLRGREDTTYRLRVGNFRVFYDVGDGIVDVITVLHKDQTAAFYRKE